MNSSSHGRITPTEAAQILFRHWRMMAAIFCLGIAITLVVIAVYPRAYSSEAKLFLRVGRESVALDPTATTGQTLLLQKSQVDEINSALDLLTSSELQRRVVESLGAKRILQDAPSNATNSSESATGLLASIEDGVSGAKSWLYGLMTKLRLADPGTETDRALRNLSRGMRVWSPKQSTVITVRYTAASPQLARDVAAAATSVFLEQHLELNHVEGSLDFFTKQADKLHSELTAAQKELRDRKNEFQIASLVGKKALFEEQIKDVELQQMNVERDLAFANAKVANLTQAIADLEPEIVTSRVAGIANEAKDGMREKLYELELEESKLKSGYQDTHPLLIQIRQQREQAEKIVAQLPEDRTQTTSALNANQRALELLRMEAKAEAKSLNARRHVVQSQLNQLRDQLLALNDREVQLVELERQVDILEQSYRMHAEKLEQARVNDALGRGRISNAKIAQPATMMSKPVAPKKVLLLALGLIVSSGAALGSLLVAESIDPTLRSPGQVEQELGLPVLLTLPQRKRKRREQLVVHKAERNGTVEKLRQRSRSPYRELTRELLSSNGKRCQRTVGVVGCGVSKERSRVAAELAKDAANGGGARVLLIDADARRRRLAKRFQLDDAPGWREIMGGTTELQNCVHRRTAGNLSVMSPGRSNGATLTAEAPIGAVEGIDELISDYGLVVVDLPPHREWDGPPFSPEWLDEVLLVVEAETTHIRDAKRTKASLERAGVRLSGVVLAQQREYLPQWLRRRLA